MVGLSPIIGGAPVRGMADSCLPVIGVIAYLFLGETSIGRKRAHGLRDAESRLAKPSGAVAKLEDPVFGHLPDAHPVGAEARPPVKQDRGDPA